MVTPKKLFNPAQLTASAATYYTVPTNAKCKITNLTFCNPISSAAPRTVTVYLVTSGGAASDSNTITSSHTLAIGESWECYEAHQILNAGDFIQMLADAATDVTAMGSGYEIT